MMTARKDQSTRPQPQPQTRPPAGRPIFQNRSSGVSLTPGEKEIIRGICQNKFFGDDYNRWSKRPTRVSTSILASRRFTPSLPAPERRTFLDFLPHVHASPIVPRLWPEDDFASGILKIVREVKVRHLARNMCSSGVMMSPAPRPDPAGTSSGAETKIEPSFSPKAIDERPTRCNHRSVMGAKRHHQTPFPTKRRTRKRTPRSSGRPRRPASSSGTVSPTRSRRKGMTKLRRVIEVSGKDGGSVRRKLYLDVFLPRVGTSEDEEEEGEGVYQSDAEQHDEYGQINRDEYDDTDGDEVEYTD